MTHANEHGTAASGANAVTDAYTPAGYCPKCGYAMDPGACPECGRAVSAERLAKVPPRVKLKRRIRWAVLLVLLVGIPYGGYRVWRDANWPAWLPNGVLMHVIGADNEPVARELQTRMRNVVLTPKEVKRLLDDGLVLEVGSKRRWPVDRPVAILLNARRSGILRPAPPSSWHPALQVSRLQVALNGKTQPATAHVHGQIDYEIVLELGDLEPGEYDVVATGEFAAATPFFAGMPRDHIWAFRKQFVLVVEDRPIEEFVELVFKNVGAQRTAVGIWNDAGRNSGRLGVRLQGFSHRLAMRLYYRVSESEPYRPFKNGDWPIEMQIRNAAQGEFECIAPFGRDVLGGAQRIDLQLRPDIDFALRRGWDQMFGGVIEWIDVPVGARIEHQTYTPATGVYEWSAETGASDE